MKKTLFIKQEKPLTVRILGASLLLMALWFVLEGTVAASQKIGMGLIGIMLLGYSISYEISADFKNSKHFKLFNFTIFKSRLELSFPDYMVVFSARFKQRAEWGPVASLGKERQGDSVVIRLFKGNKYVTLYKNKSMKKAKEKATALSELIGVEIRSKN